MVNSSLELKTIAVNGINTNGNRLNKKTKNAN